MTDEEVEVKLRICYDHALELGFSKGFEIGKKVGKKEGFDEGFRSRLTLEDIRRTLESDMDAKRKATRDMIIFGGKI